MRERWGERERMGGRERGRGEGKEGARKGRGGGKQEGGRKSIPAIFSFSRSRNVHIHEGSALKRL
jgi:hypothetical protein